MNTRSPLRAVHRWVAAVFLVTFLINVVSVPASGPLWLSYLPILPILVLTVTGSIMLIGPLVKRRSAAASS